MRGLFGLMTQLAIGVFDPLQRGRHLGNGRQHVVVVRQQPIRLDLDAFGQRLARRRRLSRILRHLDVVVFEPEILGHRLSVLTYPSLHLRSIADEGRFFLVDTIPLEEPVTLGRDPGPIPLGDLLPRLVFHVLVDLLFGWGRRPGRHGEAVDRRHGTVHLGRVGLARRVRATGKAVHDGRTQAAVPVQRRRRQPVHASVQQELRIGPSQLVLEVRR